MSLARYNPPQRMFSRWRFFFAGMALLGLLGGFFVPTARAASWEQPAADLARQIAALTGPGPARLTLLNHSSLDTAEIPLIRRLLERDLRAYGVSPGNSDSATQVRVTLSQNQQGGLWVAEILEGAESRVTMLPVTLGPAALSAGSPNLTLRRTLIFSQSNPILDASLLAVAGVPLLVVLEPERIVTYTRSGNSFASIATAPAQDPYGWRPLQTFPISHTRPFPRDPRGLLVPTPDHAQDQLFTVWLPGVFCTASGINTQLAVSCSDSDDPWPVSSTQRAFYNSTRDSFTGVLAPGYGMDLPPFYQAVEVPRPTGPALLLANTDGSASLIENNTIKPISGAGGWGSDLALIHSSCGTGVQLLVSGSGSAAAGDTLRAWEISGREAIAVSAPVPIEGAILSLNAPSAAAAANTQATMIVRRGQPGLSQPAWEVWNVAAVCN